MHENENNVMRPRTRTRPTKRGREREQDLKIWPRDHVGLENLTSLHTTSKAGPQVKNKLLENVVAELYLLYYW